MLDRFPAKAGFSLVEVLTVVIIMGILSTMGIASLRGAVLNSRIKDAGLNVTAFLSSMASESSRLSSNVCVKVESDKETLTAYKGSCDDKNLGDVVNKMKLESGNKFVSGGGCPDGATAFSNNQLTLVPKIGVSPIPAGCFVVRNGNTDKRAAILKVKQKFAPYYKLSYDNGSSWFEF